MRMGIFIILFSFFVAHCNRDHSVLSSDPDNLDKLRVPASSDSLILNDTTSIAFNDTVGNTTENIWISFDSLGTDSRCPVNVVCIWEGNAEIFFRMFNDECNSTYKLNTNPTFAQETILQGYRIELIDLLPYPHTDSLFTDNDHCAQFVISK